MSRPVLTRRGLVQAAGVALGAVSLPVAASALSIPTDPDGALVDKITRWHAATAAWEALGEESQPLRDRYDALAPERPAALSERFGDEFGVGRTVETLPNGRKRGHYNARQIEALRRLPPPTYRRWDSEPAPWGDGEDIMRPVDLPDPPRAARLAEILAAHDAWQAELDTVRDRVGLSAALLKLDEVSDIVCGLADEILSTVPTTLDGFRAKARWIREAEDDWSEQIMRDLVGVGAVAS